MSLNESKAYQKYRSSIDYLNQCLVKKTEAVTTLCRYLPTNVKPRALRHLDGQLKSAWSGHRNRFFQLRN